MRPWAEVALALVTLPLSECSGHLLILWLVTVPLTSSVRHPNQVLLVLDLGSYSLGSPLSWTL